MTPNRSTDETHCLYLKNAPHYLGELATPAHMVDYAIAAEEAGWDGVLLADALGSHNQSYIDPWITHASIASVTDELLLGSWVTPVPRRQPWQLASNLAVLDALSDGRVIFGAGFGAPWNYEVTGIGYDPGRLGEQYDESLEIIEALWQGEEVSFEGEHFSIDALELPITPVQEPRIPTFMGCWWPNKKPIQRAASYDGLMPYGPSFHGGEGVQGEQPTGTVEEETRAIVEYYRDEADGSGDILIPIDVPKAPDNYLDICRELDITWTLTTGAITNESHEQNLERIRDGPPS